MRCTRMIRWSAATSIVLAIALVIAPSCGSNDFRHVGQTSKVMRAFLVIASGQRRRGGLGRYPLLAPTALSVDEEDLDSEDFADFFVSLDELLLVSSAARFL